MHSHGLPGSGTDALTGAAADAEIRRQARCPGPAQSYGLRRADGGAAAALNAFLKHDTRSRIEPCQSNAGLLFLRKRERQKRPRGAEFRTAPAVIPAKPARQVQRHRPRSPGSRNNDPRWTIRRAELAGCAFRSKTFRIQCARRKNPETPCKSFQFRHPPLHQKRSRGEASQKTGAVDQKSSATQVHGDFLHFPLLRLLRRSRLRRRNGRSGDRKSGNADGSIGGSAGGRKRCRRG